MVDLSKKWVNMGRNNQACLVVMVVKGKRERAVPVYVGVGGNRGRKVSEVRALRDLSLHDCMIGYEFCTCWQDNAVHYCACRIFTTTNVYPSFDIGMLALLATHPHPEKHDLSLVQSMGQYSVARLLGQLANRTIGLHVLVG